MQAPYTNANHRYATLSCSHIVALTPQSVHAINEGNMINNEKNRSTKYKRLRDLMMSVYAACYSELKNNLGKALNLTIATTLTCCDSYLTARGDLLSVEHTGSKQRSLTYIRCKALGATHSDLKQHRKPHLRNIKQKSLKMCRANGLTH